MKERTMEYRGYIGSIEFSEEDGVYFGKVLGIRGLLLYEGQNLPALEQDFHDFVDDYLESCKEKGIVPEQPGRSGFAWNLMHDPQQKVAVS